MTVSRYAEMVSIRESYPVMMGTWQISMGVPLLVKYKLAMLVTEAPLLPQILV